MTADITANDKSLIKMHCSMLHGKILLTVVYVCNCFLLDVLILRFANKGS